MINIKVFDYQTYNSSVGLAKFIVTETNECNQIHMRKRKIRCLTRS